MTFSPHSALTFPEVHQDLHSFSNRIWTINWFFFNYLRKWLYSEVGDRGILVYLPLFCSLSVSSWFSCARTNTFVQRENLNSKLLVWACRNKCEWWLPIPFEIHLLVFTVTMRVGLCSMSKPQQHFMPKFGNYWVCKALSTNPPPFCLNHKSPMLSLRTSSVPSSYILYLGYKLHVSYNFGKFFTTLLSNIASPALYFI